MTAANGGTAGDGLAVTVVAESELHRHGITGMLAALPLVAEASARAPDRLGPVGELWDADVVALVCVAEAAPWARALLAAPRGDGRLLVLLDAAAARSPEAWEAAGADGYLPLEQVTTALLSDSLRRLVLRPAWPPARGRPLPRPPRDRSAVRPAGALPGVAGGALTGRERQTLGLLVEGLSNKEIAARLGISVHGAKRHVTMVLAKLNCQNRTLAVAIALRYGIVSPAGEQEVEAGPRAVTNSAM
ncbi:LuxR C-terminal-related transcriptional regulator [Kitasatospora sp. NPDC089797]|uniref:helix-turn-helix transcriptional regulator n=1 Tax=Kitasatospora sp. NPDC089797 TaxID=3155298 RepID=UPI003421007B